MERPRAFSAQGRCPTREPRAQTTADLIRAFTGQSTRAFRSSSLTAMASFPVDRLNNKTSVAILETLFKRCRYNPDSERLCAQLYGRVKALHDAVASDEGQLKRKFVDVLVRFVKLTHRDPLLLRLATSNSTPYKVRELHIVLDDIAAGLGVAAHDPITQWQESWNRAGEEMRSRLVQIVTASNERVLTSDLRGEKRVEEALMTLYASLESNEPEEFRQFRRRIHDQVRQFSSMHGPAMFDWYTPRQNVMIDKDQWIGNGTFGDVSRGTLLLLNGTRDRTSSSSSSSST